MRKTFLSRVRERWGDPDRVAKEVYREIRRRIGHCPCTDHLVLFTWGCRYGILAQRMKRGKPENFVAEVNETLAGDPIFQAHLFDEY